MLNKIFSFLSFLFLTLTAVVILYSCANIASPTGGAYDVDPPVVQRATPGFNELNSTPVKIEIEFDENIKIKTPNEKVIITPPQQNMPVIRSIGKKAVVELKDELLPNTTYTVDFTDAIVDNNEENPLENFVYSFSTGDRLDTLSISGKVLQHPIWNQLKACMSVSIPISMILFSHGYPSNESPVPILVVALLSGDGTGRIQSFCTW